MNTRYVAKQKRRFNFNPCPATLPLEVLEELQKNIVDFNGIGMSILEISHRSKEFLALLTETKSLFRELMEIPEDYEILFLGGGASLQFAMVPMNLLNPGERADYVVTDSWSNKALKEAKSFGEAVVAASTENENFRRIPRLEEIDLSQEAQYVPITSNNTIFANYKLCS